MWVCQHQKKSPASGSWCSKFSSCFLKAAGHSGWVWLWRARTCSARPARTSRKLSVNLGVKQVSDGQLLHKAGAWGHGSWCSYKQYININSSCRGAGSCTEFELVHEHIPPSGYRASPNTGWISLHSQQQGQLLLLRRKAVYSPGMEQPESIFPELASGMFLFIQLTHLHLLFCYFTS